MRETSTSRVRKRRVAMRVAGLRPIQIWVPDTRRAGFTEECRRQSLMLRGDPQEAELAAWLAEVAGYEGWT